MKRFLKILALFLAPVILLLGMFSLALLRSGELTPTADIEAAALNGGLELFGLAYRDDTRALKQAVANARGADVLGSFFGPLFTDCRRRIRIPVHSYQLIFRGI